MKCPKCGTNMPDNAKFCVKCGTALTLATSIIDSEEVSKEELNKSEAERANVEKVEQNTANTSSSENSVTEVENTTGETTNESVIESEQASSENPIENSENTAKTTQNFENSENNVEQNVNENVEVNQTNTEVSSNTTTPTETSPNATFASKAKDLLLGTDKFFFARSVLMYAIIGGMTLVLFIIGVTLGWSALMFIPLTGIGLAVLAYLQEIKKIEIKPDSLREWNKKREKNVIFKNKVENPDSLWSKLRYWHDHYTPLKYLTLILTLIALILPNVTLVTATVTSTLKRGGINGTSGSGGSSSGYVRKYKGFYPDAEYVVKYEPWEDLLYNIWDPVGMERYNNPMGSSVSFTIATEYRDPSELEDVKSLAVSMGYVFTSTRDTTFNMGDGTSYTTPGWTYEREWGPETTWQKHCYYCEFSLRDQGWDKNYKSYYAYMDYMFFNYGPNE